MSSLLATINWNQLIEPSTFVPALIFGGGFVVAIVAILAGSFASSRRHRAEIELKQDMLDRGMSADEIAKVLNAGSGK